MANEVKKEVKKEKKPKAPAVTKEQIKSVRVDGEDKIFLITGDTIRPRREGTKAAKIFAVYKDGMTVIDFLTKAKALGGTLRNVRKDTAYGRIRLDRKAA
jgi:hypothetical protein